MQDNFSYVVVVTFIRCFSFLCLFLFAFVSAPKRSCTVATQPEWGKSGKRSCFIIQIHFQRCLFIIMRLLASFIIRKSEANRDFVPGSTFERVTLPPLPSHLIPIDGVNFSPLCWHFTQFSYGP